MKYKNRSFIFLNFGILLILIAMGYGLGKWTIGRRGDRAKVLSEKNENLTKAISSPVATATDRFMLPVLTQASVALPQPPFLVSWCEGKDCEHQYSMRLSCDASLYLDAKIDSEKIAELKKGETIETRIYYTKVIKLGSYLPLEAPKRLLVSRAGKNLWVSFHDDSWDSSEWPSDEYEKNPVYEVVYPVTEAWALVKTKNGMSGFLKIENLQSRACPFVKSHL